VSLRGTIKYALFLPRAWRKFWITPNGSGLCRVRAVWLNATRDVALQAIGSDSGILRYRGRSKHQRRLRQPEAAIAAKEATPF
jgi:hypothetical protein